jgi:hypothetical protein
MLCHVMRHPWPPNDALATRSSRLCYVMSCYAQLTSSLKPLRKLKHIAKIDLRNTSVRSRERDRKHFGNKLTCKAMPVEHNEDGNER